MSLVHLDEARPLAAVFDTRVSLEHELALWRDTAELAAHLAPTEFVPTALRNKPAAITAAILRANELGISPLQGLAQIHVINGRPGLAAELMRALVQSKGHEIWTEEFTTTRVVLCGRRVGSDHVEKVAWTMDDAKRAKLDSKDPWKQYPRAMLLARCTGELCRLAFADVLAGMSYAVEELQDFIDVDVIDEPDVAASEDDKPVTRKAARPTARPRTRKAAARPRPTTTASGPPEPPLPGEEDEPPAAIDTTSSDPDEVVVKRAQQIAIRARDADVDHHSVVAAVTNGEKTSAKTLTAPEASQVLDAINAIQVGDARLVETDGTFTIETIDRADVEECDWSGAQWTEFLAEHGVAKSKVLREAASWCKTAGVTDVPSKLDDLRELDALCVHLRQWIEGQAGG